jgi:hypothetical protein
VRRWLALARKEPRPINELNRFVARLAKFSRAEIRKMRRRIVTENGPAGDRQAVVAYLSLAFGAEKPWVPSPEEAFVFPTALALAAMLALVCQTIGRIREALPPFFPQPGPTPQARTAAKDA